MFKSKDGCFINKKAYEIWLKSKGRKFLIDESSVTEAAEQTLIIKDDYDIEKRGRKDDSDQN